MANDDPIDKARTTLHKGVVRFEHCVTQFKNCSGGDPREAEMLRTELCRSTSEYLRALSLWRGVKL